MQFLGINVRDPQRDQTQDFVIDIQVTYQTIYDPPMRALTVLGDNSPPGSSRARSAASGGCGISTSAVEEDLQPVIERVAAEPAAVEP